MSSNEVKRRAAQYGVLKEMSRICSSDPIRSALEKAFDSKGDGEYVSGARKKVTVDESWLIKCEEALPHIKEAIEQSRSLIKKEGEVVRIDRAKRPSKDSVTHLCRHSNYIKAVTEDGKLAPEQIYVTDNDEDLAVYENRFLCFALNYMHSFISHRYEKMVRIMAESGVSLRVCKSSREQNRSILYRLEIAETMNGSDNSTDLKNDAAASRIRAVLNSVSGFLSTPLMKSVSAAPPLSPPIVRTNIIKNNVHFAAVYMLYAYLSSYQGDGFTVKNDVQNETQVPERVSKALSDIAALQFFAAYQGVFDGWDDCEAAYEEVEAEKRKEELRKLLLDAEAAKEALKRGERSAEEYIVLLEKSNAALSESYEKAEEDIKAYQKTEKEQEREIKRLYAEYDMMNDQMSSLREQTEERIRDDAVRIEKKYAEKTKQAIRIQMEKLDNEREAWQAEIELLNGRLHAYRIISGEKDAEEEIDNRENFIKLEKEYNALSGYYKKQWAKAKKRIRNNEYKNRNGGEKK
ncbi:MAG: hypothetical protein IJT49_09460 [Clostridia bacterium]|nr:hypothetical protein [Clostridia bacterium]